MRATLPLLIESDFPVIRRGRLETLQVNLGYKCNQSCLHCHVNAGPNRTEMMDRETLDAVIRFMDRSSITTLDLTGGAPEISPLFRPLVSTAHARGVKVIDRCNLTILLEPEQQDTASFLAANRVRIVASMPCYLKENVDRQRGRCRRRSARPRWSVRRWRSRRPGGSCPCRAVRRRGSSSRP